MESFGFGPTIGSVANDVMTGVKTAGNKLLDVLDPRAARLSLAGLALGGSAVANGSGKSNIKFAGDAVDWRVKLSLAEAANYFYKTTDAGLLAPLRQSGGVIFPYTPTISVTHAARYSNQQLTHSNYTNYSYEGSEVQAITIAGEFTAQNNVEAAYVLACIQFFRAATKMWFGGTGDRVGNPPPMVFLNGYGTHYFPNVPCVITSFQHTMPAEVDYISAITGTRSNAAPTSYEGNTEEENNLLKSSTPTTLSDITMIPTTSSISVTLQPIYSRRNVYENSNLDKFARGDLIGNPKAGKGGFI